MERERRTERRKRRKEEVTRKVMQRPCAVHAFLYVVGEGCPKCRALVDEEKARPRITVTTHANGSTKGSLT